MKPIFLLLLGLVLSVSSLEAQPATDGDARDVATTWPGVHFLIFHVERIAGNRLLIGVKVYATPQAPPTGTMIGIPVPIPKDALPQEIGAGLYRPLPFSLETATMTDEATRQTYPTMKPDPAGPTYVAGKILTSLHPNEGAFMSIQFPVPPPPDPASSAKQTISILLPNALKAITGIELPPPAPSAATP